MLMRLFDQFVIRGADRDLAGAQAEVDRLKSAGFTAEVVKRGNRYRTVVPVKKSDQAGATLD
jgi:hypothetical protein